MLASVKAYCFRVEPDESSPREISDLLKNVSAIATPIHVSAGAGQYTVSETIWHEQERAFTASVFKLRKSSLPAAVRDDAVGSLPISPDTDLGEPMCFAYYPNDHAAIVQYSHHGPRHTVIAPFLSEIGLAHPVSVEPKLRDDMEERFHNTTFYRSVTSTVHIPIDALGRPASHAIDLAKEVGGG
jgi:hypothetical protein